jgi:excisionase family DNA binding protein
MRKTAKKRKAPPMPRPDESPYYTIAEAAAYLRTTKWNIGAAIRSQELPKIPLGHKYVLFKADLDAFAAKIRVAA